MSLVMFMCLKNIDRNLEVGIGNTLSRESKHLGGLEGLVQESSEYMERMGIISASFTGLCSIIDFWEQRGSLLIYVHKIFEFVID